MEHSNLIYDIKILPIILLKQEEKSIIYGVKIIV